MTDYSSDITDDEFSAAVLNISDRLAPEEEEEDYPEENWDYEEEDDGFGYMQG